MGLGSCVCFCLQKVSAAGGQCPLAEVRLQSLYRWLNIIDSYPHPHPHPHPHPQLHERVPLSLSTKQKKIMWSNFQLSVQVNPGLHWFCFTMLCDWSRKLTALSQEIRYKTKTNGDLVTRVFPRFRPVMFVYFEFSLALSDIFLCSDWPLWLLRVWFYHTQSKSALLIRFN